MVMQLKNLFFALASVASLLSISSCEKITGEGPLQTETRSRGSFSGIDMRISGNVQVKKDSVYKIEVTAQQNLLNEIETNIVGTNLVIKFRDGVRVRTHEEITVNISSPELSTLRLSGSGNVNVSGQWQSRNFWLELSGSGNIYMQRIAADYIDGKVSGSGNITVLDGTALEENLRITGSGNIDMLSVAARSAYTTTSGSGSMKLNVSDNLNVTISGSGSVYYTGNPAVSAKVSGSGTVGRL